MRGMDFEQLCGEHSCEEEVWRRDPAHHSMLCEATAISLHRISEPPFPPCNLNSTAVEADWGQLRAPWMVLHEHRILWPHMV
jgi:hypothetical protein